MPYVETGGSLDMVVGMARKSGGGSDRTTSKKATSARTSGRVTPQERYSSPGSRSSNKEKEQVPPRSPRERSLLHASSYRPPAHPVERGPNTLIAGVPPTRSKDLLAVLTSGGRKLAVAEGGEVALYELA